MVSGDWGLTLLIPMYCWKMKTAKLISANISITTTVIYGCYMDVLSPSINEGWVPIIHTFNPDLRTHVLYRKLSGKFNCNWDIMFWKKFRTVKVYWWCHHLCTYATIYLFLVLSKASGQHCEIHMAVQGHLEDLQWSNKIVVNEVSSKTNYKFTTHTYTHTHTHTH